jgi:hypothetical protein
VSYEQLDLIADSVNPALGLVWLAAVLFWLLRWRPRRAGFALGFGLLALCFAYGFMWLDRRWSAFAGLGLDFSTHAAVAAAMGVTLAVLFARARLALAALLLGYFALMLYQRYHSLADILCTLALLTLPYAAMLAFALGRVRSGRRAAAGRAPLGPGRRSRGGAQPSTSTANASIRYSTSSTGPFDSAARCSRCLGSSVLRSSWP